MLFESRLIRAAASNSEAFTQLYNRYLKPTYAFIAFRVKPEEAEDLTSVLWMKILDRLPTLENPKPEVFRAWIFTMARNLVIDHYRKHKNTVPLDEIELEDPTPLNKSFLEEDRVRALVRELPPQQSEVVSLKYFSGLRNKEIAVLLTLSEKTVASNLSRALKNLRRTMQ